eukprot:CAMPEP_0202690668 /NCGR_PEP_ID=MMETSP1385-20130828/5588_1 /ASSEMBLY_ACC=CAM_ASM_000861 /TAXON_ID=933848 /ORGANISM="Elphidium margaritaceum" /LENGTH=469 /DNA_ID=CAMNT_0049345949 /DNA_START=61 /DNA_END=1470 /DNA_ORIENTATION=+
MSAIHFVVLFALHAARSFALNVVCISGAKISYTNGLYEYHSWNSDIAAPIYYNAESEKYLYPWVYSRPDNMDYFISSDPTQDAVTSYCNVPSTDENPKPADCSNEGGQQWTSFNGTHWINEPDLRLTVGCGLTTLSPSVDPTVAPSVHPSMSPSVLTTPAPTGYCEDIVVEMTDLIGISSFGYSLDVELQQLVANATYDVIARSAEQQEDVNPALFELQYESVSGEINVTHSVCASFLLVLNVLHDVVTKNEEEIAHYIRNQTVAYFENVQLPSVDARNLKVQVYWSMSEIVTTTEAANDESDNERLSGNGLIRIVIIVSIVVACGCVLFCSIFLIWHFYRGQISRAHTATANGDNRERDPLSISDLHVAVDRDDDDLADLPPSPQPGMRKGKSHIAFAAGHNSVRVKQVHNQQGEQTMCKQVGEPSMIEGRERTMSSSSNCEDMYDSADKNTATTKVDDELKPLREDS